MVFVELPKLHSEGVSCLAFSPSGDVLCSTSLDTTAIFYDVRTSNAVTHHLQSGHTDAINCATFVSNTIVCTASDDHKALLWDSRNLAVPVATMQTKDGINKVVIGCASQLLYTAGDDGVVTIFDSTGNKVDAFIAAGAALNDAICIPVPGVDGMAGEMLVTAAEDGSVRVWCGGPAADAQAQMARLGQNGPAEVHDAAAEMPAEMTAMAGRMRTSIDEFEVAVNHVHAVFEPTAEHPGRARLFAGASETLVAMPLDCTTGSIAGDASVLQGHTDYIRGIVSDPISERRGVLYTAGDDRELMQWDIMAGSLVRKVTAHNDMVMALAVDPAGRVLATGSEDSSVRIWTLPLQSQEA